MDIKKHDEGAPSWVALTTPNIAVSTQFYGQLFGWEYEDGFGGLNTSKTCLVRDRPVAVMTPEVGAERGVWTMFVNVTDADKTAELVTIAGGSVLTQPHDLGASGRSAVFADHSGTTFGVWQAGSHAGTGVVDEPGTSSWSELITDDVEASQAFYGLVFDWSLAAPEGPLNRREWQLNGRAVSELLPRPPVMPAEIPPYWDVYFTVADAEAATRAVDSLGGTTLMRPTPIRQGTIAVFADPTGAVFTVMEPST